MALIARSFKKTQPVDLEAESRCLLEPLPTADALLGREAAVTPRVLLQSLSLARSLADRPSQKYRGYYSLPIVQSARVVDVVRREMGS